MNKGKRICERLKIIRKYVAKANGIEYEPTPCDFEGDCPGTCPQCEAELAELQRQLDEKEKRGEKVIYVDGISLEEISEEERKIMEDPTDDVDVGLRGVITVDGWDDEKKNDKLTGYPRAGGKGGHSCTGCIIAIVVGALIIAALLWNFLH